MPSGCGSWPAFWLTDEANWPVNGEIDIVEGVNFQDDAKTAMHTTKGCDMYDVPVGTMTGTWDSAIGIPDKKTVSPVNQSMNSDALPRKLLISKLILFVLKKKTIHRVFLI